MKKLLTFTASWCGPCKMLKPILQQLHDEGLIVWENHDIDQEPKFAQNFLVGSVPTLFFYEANGNVSHKESGFMPREKVLKLYYPNGDFKDVATVVAEAAPIDDVIIEDVVASEDDEAFVFSDEDFASLPDADETNESHPELDGAANGFVDVVLEAEDIFEAVLEAEDVVGVVLDAEDIIEVLLDDVEHVEDVVDVAQTGLKPKAVTDADNLILSFDFEEEPIVFDDEFSSEDLGNDTPDDVVNPDDLF
jgi:thioredoxin 1